MRKLKLDMDALAVESFDVAAGRGGAGTVRGHGDGIDEAGKADYTTSHPPAETCLPGYCTVVTPTCAYSECWTNCDALCPREPDPVPISARCV